MSEKEDRVARINPEEVRYIKLGPGGARENASLDGGRLDWGFSENPHDLAPGGDRTRVRQFYVDRGIAPATSSRETGWPHFGRLIFYPLGPAEPLQ